ncbi:putative Calmodulin-binding [Blattamonas nauphoetae]|uniref:Calmodulin-binding n=1 Tax=Blattamonas nauphoetae TaxID=2049346 RepID=A0ABQ9YEV8_9EUKA|nr:putative Calmodulin-binding [Blattamonas nauphoetae]
MTETKKQRPHGTMGVPRVEVSPQNFTRVKDRTLPKTREFRYEDPVPKKDPVPLRVEEPIHGLQTNQNFIQTNAITIINTAAKKPPHKEIHYTNKKGYGERPKYLDRVNEEIQQEQTIKRDIMTQRAYTEMVASREPELMSEEEKAELLSGLKKRWAALRSECNKIGLHIDIDSIRIKKESLERQMGEIEHDMERLSKKRVYVERY